MQTKYLIIAVAVILALGFLGIGCVLAPGFLEFEDVFQYKLEIDPITKEPARISGLSGKSMLCVTGVTTKRYGETLVILAELGNCKNGRTGSFSYQIHVPNDVSAVAFGTKRHVVWKRIR